jgi:hypothetical protein
MNMNLSELINEILSEWAYRCDDGMPNPKNPIHLKELGDVLSEMGLSHIKNTLVENLLMEKGKTPERVKEAEGSFTNPILNKKIKYKNTKGEDAEGIVGNLLRLPAEHPGRKAAEALLPADDSPERDAINKDLGGQGQAAKPEDGKDKKGGDEAGGEEEKAKAAQAMFDPKNDPAMAARMDKEKEVQAQLAKDAEADKEAEKAQEPKKEDEFAPIDSKDVSAEMPQADPETFNGDSDIPDGISPEDLEQFNTDISKVQQMVADAKAKGEKAPNINLCQITVPGTNLYCDDNLGIPREEMPQFKGKPQPGTPAAEMAVDKNGEVDTEPLFKKMLEEKGVKVVQTEVPSDKLKATQSELVGAKVVGMMEALEENPEHPSITAPIYVSRDGFVVDGHHRWAAIAAFNAKNPDKQIPMKVQVIDMDIKDAIPMCNKFAEEQGVAAKKADANKEAPTEQPSEPTKREPANDDPESKAQQFKGKSSGEDIQTMEMEGGGFMYGTKHGNTAMVDDILDDVKSKIPKERWGDVVFVGEGGATGDSGEVEFNDEMDYAAPKFKEMGAGVDTWDGDDMDVHNDQSKLYQKQKEKTGFNDSQVKAGNWASMIGQGEGTDTMSPNDFLDDEGKQFLQDAAKEAGFPSIENWDEPTEQDIDTLYRLSFPEDNGDTPTKINDIQVAFNDARDEHLIEKNKELTAQGKIPITIAGESHVDLVDKMTRNKKAGANSKAPKEPSKEDGGTVYSLGGGYYSDTPNGPAQYMVSESLIEKLLVERNSDFGYLLFEAVVTKKTSKGNNVKLVTIDPKNQEKATADAASSNKKAGGVPPPPPPPPPPLPKQVTSASKLTDKVRQKISKWTEKEKAFFDKNEGAPGSEMRRSLGQALKDKAAGALKAIKKGFKHEVEEFKEAGKGVQNFFSGKPLSEKEQKALKAVAFKVVTTAVFGAAFGGLSHGVAAFGKHVAMEFIPHIIGETLLKGVGKAAVFADAEGEAETDANMIKFTELIAKGLEEMEITPEMMEQMVDSYNEKKENGEVDSETTTTGVKAEHLHLVDELMLEMIYGFIDEIKPKSKQFQAISKKSGKVSDFDSEEARDAAVKKGTHKDVGEKDDSAEPVSGAGLFDDPEYQQRMGAETPPTQTTPTEKYPYENMDPKELERIQNELYPKTKNGELVLLSENPSAQNAFNKGYVQGSWWVAPGNPGSSFNENGSNEGVKILEKYSDMSEDDLARLMHNKFCPTKLGSEQKKVAGKTRIVVPPDIKNKECYQNCVIAARSARTKFNRIQDAVTNAQEKGFGKTSKIHTFGGTQTKVGKNNSELDTTPTGIKGDKQNMIDIVSSVPENGKCFIYDKGTGITFEVPKQKLIEWIAAGGGGENAADTVIMSVDENGNVVYCGHSDKKTLKDIQGNSTLNYDFIQNKNRLNDMLSFGLIDEKTHQKAMAILDENLKAITEIEANYKTVSAVNAKHFSEVTPNEMNQLSEELSQRNDTAKYFKLNEDNINKIKNLKEENAASYTDDFSMLVMENMMGEKRKKSKDEMAAEKQLNEITSKYPEYETVAKLKIALKDKKISASTDEEKAQAAADLKALNDSEKIIKKSRTEYVSKFIDWKNTKKGQTKIKSVSSFRVLSNIASNKNNTSLLNDDQRKLIERAASYERYKYKLAELSSKKVKDKNDLTKIASLEKALGISANKLDKKYKTNIPKSLDTGKLLGELRKKSLDVQTETYKKLNTLVGKSTNGKKKKVGDLLAFRDANSLYHLDKINEPKDENDIHQILKRSTNLTMEGLDVDADTIKSCLDVEDTRELEDLFELDFDNEEYTYNEDGEVTGKTVIIYSLTKDGVKKQVGKKVYRGKDGPTSPTSTTIDWSDDMQKCFESKGTYDRKSK